MSSHGLTKWSSAAFGLILAAGCSRSDPAGGRGPAPAARGLTAEGDMRIGEDDRCPVCGMLVHKHPAFASALELRDGRAFYFCGTGCLIRTWLHPERVLRAERSDIRRAVVRDYFDGKPLDALAAHWVAGSDVVGPMGPALVPLRNVEDVGIFRKRHGGKRVFRLGELDDAAWKAITGKPAVPRSR